MTDNLDNTIDKYYSFVDKKLILNLCKNNNLKNLIKLSTISDLYIFNKKNKKWQLKNKDILLKECQNIKKKELKTSSIMLSNLAKLNIIHDITKIKGICDNLQNKISNLDNLINYINHIESSSENISENDASINKKYNIVSFNEINIINKKPEPEEILKLDIINLNQSLSDISDSFIECYSNC